MPEASVLSDKVCDARDIKLNCHALAGLLGAAGLVVLLGTVGFVWDLRRRRRAAAAHAASVRDLIPAAPSGVWRGAQVAKQGGVHGIMSATRTVFQVLATSKDYAGLLSKQVSAPCVGENVADPHAVRFKPTRFSNLPRVDLQRRP